MTKHQFLGRRIMVTTLDPIPRMMRASPGYIVLNKREIDALQNSDQVVFRELAEIAQAEDAGEARQVWRYRSTKRRK